MLHFLNLVVVVVVVDVRTLIIAHILNRTDYMMNVSTYTAMFTFYLVIRGFLIELS